MSTPVTWTWDGSHLNAVDANGALLFQADGAARELLTVGLTGQETLTITPAQLNLLVARINSLRSYLVDGMLQVGTIIISATAEKFKTTTTAIYTIGGAIYSKAATDNLVFAAANAANTVGATGTATAFWGVWLIEINAAGTVLAKPAAGAPMVYTTEALAIAALPAVTASSCRIGYITVQNLTNVAWVATTSNLTEGAGEGNCTASNFYDLPAVKTLPAAIA